MEEGNNLSDEFERVKAKIDALKEKVEGGLKVKDVMTPNVVTASRDASITEAARLMEQYDISSVVVMDGRGPVGIITERDIVRKVVLRDLPREKSVEEAMSSPLISTRCDTELRAAAIRMMGKKIRRLPVVEDDRLLGILTVTDILKTPPSYASLF